MKQFGCEFPGSENLLKKSHLVPSSPRIHHEVASENDVLWMAGICYSSCCGGLTCIYRTFRAVQSQYSNFFLVTKGPKKTPKMISTKSSIKVQEPSKRHRVNTQLISYLL